MTNIRKLLVTDEHSRPIAVQIDYADWLKIEQMIQPDCISSKPQDLSRFAGVLALKKFRREYSSRTLSRIPIR